jgi:NADP-dependent aldehyde dehydrogenase
MTVEAAVHAAPVLRAMPPADIADLLDRIAAELEARRAAVVATADAETSLGETRLNNELTRTTGQLQAFAGLVRTGRHLDAVIEHAVIERGTPDLRRMNVPLGPVVVFGAGNFPLAFSVPGGDTAAALAAGCPVIAKAHPSHPKTSDLCAEAINAAGLPAGAFALVHGGNDVGAALVTDDAVEAVAFTGSTAGGRALFDLAAQRRRPIPVFAEMGSVNPVFVTPAAAAERAREIATGLAGSATMGMGQFCTKPGLVFVPRDHADAFVDALVEAMAEVAPGDMLDPRIHAGYQRELDVLRALPGVRLWEGKPGDGPLSAAPAVAVVDEDRLHADEALTREHFGPVATVVACTDLAAQAQRVEGSLTATIHAAAADPDAAALRDALVPRVGRLVHNGWPTGVAVTDAMVHGGPYPATTAPSSTSVGLAAIRRFLRPVAFQDVPDALLPPALQDANPWGVARIG